MIHIKHGLDLPIEGAPDQNIQQADLHRSSAQAVNTIGILGQDYVGLKPTMAIREDEEVAAGQLLFSDKKNSALRVVAPIAGKIKAINRGHKRVLLSVTIEADHSGRKTTFENFTRQPVSNFKPDQAKALMIESGLWTAFRERPFGKVPTEESKPAHIFVTAMDSNPLAANPAPIIAQRLQDFNRGLEVIGHLTSGRTYLCTAPEFQELKLQQDIPSSVTHEVFSGPHPAGLVGTHMHFLAPISMNRKSWYINYQDVIAIGVLFNTGEYDANRIIALAGPHAKKPRLIEATLGASLSELTTNECHEGEVRVISGSVLSGAHSKGFKHYLGRYHLQVSILKEGRERGFMEYLSPGKDKHSVAKIYLSQFAKKLKLPMTTTTNGSQRAMVPIGLYEEIMPLDILPTQLLRSIIVGDTETAIELGVLELEEEDLGLCTYVCPGKYEYGPILRKNLTQIEQEG